MQTPIITLTTDWGTKDYYVGVFKGHLYSALPEARIVDITHEVEQYDTRSAAIMVRHACMAFPQGTIHIVDVFDASQGESYMVARCDGHYFICQEGNLLYMALQKYWDEAVRVELPADARLTFVADTLFLPLAVRLAQGASLQELGTPITQQGATRHVTATSLNDNTVLKVTIVHVDTYGNALLGITREEFDQFRAGREFKYSYRREAAPVTTISTSYVKGVDANGLMLVETSSGYLQLVLRYDSALQLLALQKGGTIMFTFE